MHLPQIGWREEPFGLDRLIAVARAAQRLGFGDGMSRALDEPVLLGAPDHEHAARARRLTQRGRQLRSLVNALARFAETDVRTV